MRRQNKLNKLRFARIYLGGASQPEEQPTEVLKENPVKTTATLRRNYGQSTLLSEREKHERGVVDENNSAMPEPKGEVTKEDILFLQRHLYEGKPLKT